MPPPPPRPPCATPMHDDKQRYHSVDHLRVIEAKNGGTYTLPLN